MKQAELKERNSEIKATKEALASALSKSPRASSSNRAEAGGDSSVWQAKLSQKEEEIEQLKRAIKAEGKPLMTNEGTLSEFCSYYLLFSVIIYRL